MRWAEGNRLFVCIGMSLCVCVCVLFIHGGWVYGTVII